MAREHYEQELRRLQLETVGLGRKVQEALTESVRTLAARDMEGSRRVVAHDRMINKARFAIEADALVLIATQQPMAGDLRTLAAILDIAGELERMGDYAKGIAKISLMIADAPLIKPLIDIPRMAERTCDMLRRALEAFIRRDVEAARIIPKDDDVVDALYNQVYRELLFFILTDPRNIEQANYLLWAAHNLERAADRVTNICERVIFTVTGELVELDVEDDASPPSPGEANSS